MALRRMKGGTDQDEVEKNANDADQTSKREDGPHLRGMVPSELGEQCHIVGWGWSRGVGHCGSGIIH
jgi:hypothetical protein